MPHRTAVVILNWNTRKFLEEFLPDVILFTKDVAEIIVADNASTDDTVAFIKSNFPSVRIICNPKNDGFTGGYNTALSQVDADYFVLLNSDVAVTENWLKPIIDLMDSRPEIGACQPKILSYHNTEYFEYAGAGGGFIDKLGYPFCRGRIFNTLEKDEHQYDDIRPVFWASGACMIVRSSVYRELNGLDESFFAHMEEIDFCWRMQNLGHKVFYYGKSHVLHVGGGTLPKSSPRKTYLNFRNNLLMIYKNSQESDLQYILSMRFMLDFIASVKFLLSGNFPDFKAVWRARSDFQKLKSRHERTLPKDKTFSNDAVNLVYPKSILWDYYLCGEKKVHFSELEGLED